jgi:hypothetical protein
MKRFLLVASLVVLASCASGPVAGTSAIAHGVGDLVVAALPPGFHSLGEMAVNALIALSEQQGWTKEEFIAACQSADLSASTAAGQTPSVKPLKALPLDDKARARAKDYIDLLTREGR